MRSSRVFCDWLDVTCSPDDSFLDDLALWLNQKYFFVAYSDKSVTRYVTPDQRGSAMLERKHNFHKASLSGVVLDHLRSIDCLGELLGLLGSVRHKVTRLDAALDVWTDCAPVLRKLERKFPDGRVNLSRKALKVTQLYSVRDDGKLSGTWYVGHRTSARVTARVYDKQLEALEKRGEAILPCTRYELTFRKDHGCSLQDALVPHSLFYQYASPTLLKSPEGAPGWVSDPEGWKGVKPDLRLPYEVYKRRVELSPEIDALVNLALKLGPKGQPIAERIFRERLEAAFRAANGAAEGGRTGSAG